jgi:hypothetical protein
MAEDADDAVIPVRSKGSSPQREYVPVDTPPLVYLPDLKPVVSTIDLGKPKTPTAPRRSSRITVQEVDQQLNPH